MVRRRLESRVLRLGVVVAVGALLTAPLRAWGDAACQGDCNGDGRVTIAEVITVVNMNFGILPTSTCPNGTRRPGEIDNVDVVCALRNALFTMCESYPP